MTADSFCILRMPIFHADCGNMGKLYTILGFVRGTHGKEIIPGAFMECVISSRPCGNIIESGDEW